MTGTMIVLKLDTKKSLFEPLEIEIDGQAFRIRPITLGALEKIQALQIEMAAGSARAIREMLETVIEGDITVLMGLTIDQLQQLMTVIVERSVRPTGAEKNGHGPGDEPTH